jgi:hypothetical protein
VHDGEAAAVPDADRHAAAERLDRLAAVEATDDPILPGWDWKECSQATAKTLEKAVALAIDWKNLLPNKTQQAAEADDCFTAPDDAEKAATLAALDRQFVAEPTDEPVAFQQGLQPDPLETSDR